MYADSNRGWQLSAFVSVTVSTTEQKWTNIQLQMIRLTKAQVQKKYQTMSNQTQMSFYPQGALRFQHTQRQLIGFLCEFLPC